MRHIRSKKLYRFLKEQGALNNPREIKRLKREYRRLYQNQWAKQQRKNRFEIRFSLSSEEFQKIKERCQKESTTPTELAKELLLSHTNSETFIPKRSELITVAKELGLAINRIKAEGGTDLIIRKLISAETILLNYLKT